MTKWAHRLLIGSGVGFGVAFASFIFANMLWSGDVYGASAFIR